jgi:hypothetical protein
MVDNGLAKIVPPKSDDSQVTHEMIKDRGQEEARFMVINCNSLIHHQQ